MILRVLALALLISACRAPAVPRASPAVPSSACRAPAERMLAALPVGLDLLVVGCDTGACVQAALDAAHASGHDGVRVSGRIALDSTITVRGVLAGPAILDATAASLLPWGALLLTDDAVLADLTLRGPYAGRTNYPVRLHEDWTYTGINAAHRHRWRVANVDVDGFPGTGLLGVESSNITITDSRFAHSGYSGVSLFPHGGDCGSGVRIVRTVMEHNGQNGIDACASSMVLTESLARGNGWGGLGGDMNGLLHFSYGLATVRDVLLAGNRVCENHGDAIRVHGHDVRGVVLRENVISGAVTVLGSVEVIKP
jgi:hypothetical protein